MRVRAKPVVVKAEQIIPGAPVPLGVCFCDYGIATMPQTNVQVSALSPWMKEFGAKAHVHASEGARCVGEYDWIITGAKGERIPVNDSIFHETYERVGED